MDRASVPTDPLERVMMSAVMNVIRLSVRTLFGAAATFTSLSSGDGAPALAQGMTLEVCPTDYGSFPENAPTLTCGCSAAAVKDGAVRGANPYYYQSSLCRAALHAGAIGEAGGQIVVEPSKQAFFPAVSKNGVESDSWGEGMGFTIVVAGATPSAPQTSETPPQPTTGSTSATPPAAASSSSAPEQTAGMTLDVCPTDYGSFPEDAPALTCGCTAEAVKSGTVRGANPYYYQSGLCRAALHAGAIGAEGGQITVEPSKQAFFPAVARNGVEGDSWNAGMGFRVVVAEGATAPSSTGASTSAPAQQQAAGMTLDVCPSNYGSFPEDAPALTCGCAAAAVKDGTVRGANPYYYQSSLCRAALHAGAVGAEGGQITVRPSKQAFFPAVTRNGVEGDSWGAGMGFEVAVADGATATGSGATSEPLADMTLDVCPSNYGSFPEDAPSLSCACAAEATKDGTVRGANPYYYQSSLCRAAVHAGAIGPDGGQIVVGPSKQPFFPAVTRNGVESDSWGEGMGFQVTAVPGQMPEPAAGGPAVDAAGQPVQAPIAATLQATGKVQLYINFATDKDQPLPTSEPVLQELLQALQDDPTLRLALIGHTDSQGSAPYNLDLSQRRAASVYLWLVQHGIESGRLRSDGRGLMEPIADNATDSGRALNRRVEAKAMN
jgi:outer membrane protein OmpA-like peptidoglycan-associated protein